MNILQRINLEHEQWEEDIILIADAFDQLLLPIPEPGEYLYTYDNGYLSPLDFAGCMVRVTEASSVDACLYPARSDFILQPLARFNAGHYTVDVLPGVLQPSYDMTEEEAECWSKVIQAQIEPMLEAQNYRVYDIDAYNLGVLPAETRSFPMGCPVLVDPDTVVDHNYYLKPLKQLLFRLGRRQGFQPTMQTPLQAEIYGDLHDAFAEACCAPGKYAMQSLMKKAWARCHDAAYDGRLVTNWHRPLKNTKETAVANVSQVATAFDRHLRQSLSL